jgi:homoserine dehydrogenase
VSALVHDLVGGNVSGRLALLGTGCVGTAFVQRYQRLHAGSRELPRLDAIGNSRGLQLCRGDMRQALDAVNSLPRQNRVAERPSLQAGDILVDATASDDIADAHARWLARGVHVVTANKLGCGAGLDRAKAILMARQTSTARYGDGATVGAGLPVLRSLRALVSGGDRIHLLEGVLSGSLAWLFQRFDGTQPFSTLVHQARDEGYCEPDPRIDLSGEDVRRKLLILARAIGQPLQPHEVRVESLLPAWVAAAPPQQVDQRLSLLDLPLQSRLQRARRDGMQLRFVARLEVDGRGHCSASVGLRTLLPSHPLCAGTGTDNRVAIHSCRYRDQPLVIQGPGAGAEVTAAALLDDVTEIASLNR